MTGRVFGHQAKIGIKFPQKSSLSIEIECVVDTGFEGALTLPEDAVSMLGLPFVEHIGATLADHSHTLVSVHRAKIEWNSREEEVAVLAMGQRPLLGTALLAGCDLTIHFEDGGAVRIEPF